MAGGIIGLIGGNPLMKVKQVIGEKLPLTKSLDGGAGLGDMVKEVMNGGGLQSIVSNPMGALTGALSGQVSGLVGQLSGVAGASGLIEKMTGAGGLIEKLGGLTAAGDGLLSGQGILDQIGHANVMDMFGAALPAGLGLDTVLGPLNADAMLNTISTALPSLVQQVVAGTQTVAAATAIVDGYRMDVAGTALASSFALGAVAEAAPNIAAVSTIAAATVAAPPEIQAVLERAVDPAALATMKASVAKHIEEP